MNNESFIEGELIQFRSACLTVQDYDAYSNMFTCYLYDPVDKAFEWKYIMMPAFIRPFSIYEQDYEFIVPANNKIYKGVAWHGEYEEFVERTFGYENGGYSHRHKMQARVADDFDTTGKYYLTSIPTDGDYHSGFNPLVIEMVANKQLSNHQQANGFVGKTIDCTKEQYMVQKYVHNTIIESLLGNHLIQEIQLIDQDGSTWWAEDRFFQSVTSKS